MDDRSVSGKTVLLTGAGRGLGFAMAEGLAAAGANVAMLGTDADVLRDAVARVESAHRPGCAIAVVADVTDEERAREAIEETVLRYGAIDVLINNAAIGPQAAATDYIGDPPKFWQLDGALWTRVMTVNTFGPQLMAQFIVPDMLNRGWGRIINVTTSLDTMYSITGGAYGPSKAALEANTVIMARDLEGSGVSANILVPGGLADTRIVPPSLHASRAALIRPEVMRAPAVWLSSEASNGINGMRFIAARWDPELPLAERIEHAGAPAAWPQLGSQSIHPGD